MVISQCHVIHPFLSSHWKKIQWYIKHAECGWAPETQEWDVTGGPGEAQGPPGVSLSLRNKLLKGTAFKGTPSQEYMFLYLLTDPQFLEMQLNQGRREGWRYTASWRTREKKRDGKNHGKDTNWGCRFYCPWEELSADQNYMNKHPPKHLNYQVAEGHGPIKGPILSTKWRKIRNWYLKIDT